MERFDINADISVAKTLPADFYTSDRCFEASKELVFAKTWQFAGLRRDIDNVLPFSLLDPMLAEPLLIAGNGAMQCFSNVCTHRANILIDRKCRIDGIRCRYHGRRFDLNGKFLSMPEFEGVGKFPTEEDNLRKVPLGEWGRMLFVSLDPAERFEAFFEPILKRFGNFEADADISTREYIVDTHWALYCENYLEGFHIPYIHSALNRELEFTSYRTVTYRFSSLQTAHAPENFSDGEPAAHYYFVFPNLMLNFYPWGLSANVVEPISKERTRIRYITLVTDPSETGKGAGADLDTVEKEDQEIVETVQKGIRSRFYRRGRYSVTRETGLHHFHRLIAEFMNDGEKEWAT